MKRRQKAFAAIVFLPFVLAPLPATLASARDKPNAFHPKLTAWGDPDFQATWTDDRIYSANIPLERPEASGARLVMTDAEFAKRLEAAKKSDGNYKETVDADGTAGLGQWLQSTPFGRRTSLIVSPANGRLPPKTAAGEALFKAGRNSWVDKQAIDWVSDLDSYDRCVSRGFPAAMLPWSNNNGMGLGEILGGVFGPSIAGSLSDAYGLSAPCWMLVALALLGSFAALFLRETAPRILGDTASLEGAPA